MAKIIITESLQNTVIAHEKISVVHFDAKGRHYFNVHRLRADKNDTNQDGWELYGSGIYSHQELIPGIFNVDKKKEAIAKGNPDTKIVSKMTRDEILSASIKKEDNSLASQVHNSSEIEKAFILEALGLDSETIDLIKELKNKKTEDKEEDEDKVI